jgi:hypothetical protein
MRKRDRLISSRRQSSERIAKEDLWFFNEETQFNQSPVHSNKIGKDDRFRGIREDYDPFMTKTSEKNKLSKECLFVVDWQLTDA